MNETPKHLVTYEITHYNKETGIAEMRTKDMSISMEYSVSEFAKPEFEKCMSLIPFTFTYIQSETISGKVGEITSLMLSSAEAKRLKELKENLKKESSKPPE